MFFRFLGKFFFYFYIIPRITREFRTVRRYLNPIINAAIMDAAQKQKDDLARARATHPAGSRL